MLLDSETALHAAMPFEPRSITVSTQVEARAEPAPCPREHHHPTVAVLGNGLERSVQFRDHPRCHRIQGSRPVELDGGDSVTGMGDLDVGHGTSCHDYASRIVTGRSRLLPWTLSGIRNGSRDPTTRTGADWLVRASLDSDGVPFVRKVSALPDGHARVTTKSDTSIGMSDETSETTSGHPWLGDFDPGHQVVPCHPAVADAMHRFGTLALARTDNPYHELLPAVLAQRVTAKEALAQWRETCTRWGEAIEFDGVQCHAPPVPGRLLEIPFHEWHLLGVDRRRAEALRNVARHGERLLRGWKTDLPASERTESLSLIPGIGEWTAAVAGHTAFGDPDALEFGDFHVKNTVAWALTGRPRGTDDEMRTTMEPYLGERRRVLSWLSLAGWGAPARGPRQRIVDIARL